MSPAAPSSSKEAETDDIESDALPIPVMPIVLQRLSTEGQNLVLRDEVLYPLWSYPEFGWGVLFKEQLGRYRAL